MRKRHLILCSILVGMVFLFSFFTSSFAESSAKPIELKVANWGPPNVPIANLLKQWGKMVEERSGNRVKLVFYWAQSLAAYKDTYRAMQTGVADIGVWVFGVIAGIHTLNEFTSLPLIGWDNIYTATKVYHEMRSKFPQLDGELKGLKLLYATPMAPNQFHFTEKTVRIPEDLRGMKLIASGDWPKALGALNAAAVQKGPPDWYMSLQKGLADGHIIHWPGALSFKLTELLKTHTEAGEAGFNLAINGLWMNVDTWNSLPQEAQKAFMDSQDWIQNEDLKLSMELIEKGRAEAKEMGHTFVELTPEERELWAKALAPVHEKWIAEAEAKGLPGKAVYDEAKRLISLYNK